MRISPERLISEAETTGFRPEILEKVIQLFGLLDNMNSHPFLKNKFVLKGGTALNLFVFDVPRLSVDIDLNYIGAEDPEAMMAERPKLDEAIQALFARNGFQVRRMPDEHAGGKWSLRYEHSQGRTGNLEVDINYMLRIPLFPIKTIDSRPVGSWQATGVPVLDIHELAAGKLAALLARKQGRDLFDCANILKLDTLDPLLLRLAFVVYGAMNRKDWRTVSIDDVDFEAAELARQLIPVLRSNAVPGSINSLEYGKLLVKESRDGLKAVLPFSESERAFLNLLLDKGIVDSTLLTNDTILQKHIQNQPLLTWKALNVKEHKGLE